MISPASRLRVLHLTPRLFGEEGVVGGGERYPLELARAMSAHVPTRLAGFAGRARRDIDGRLEIHAEKRLVEVAGRPHDPVNLSFLRHILWADVVHFHQFRSTACALGSLLGRPLRRRLYVTDHGGGGSNLLRRLRLGRWLHAHLSQSAFTVGTMPYVGRRHEVIFAGVDTDLYRPGAAKVPGRVVYLGRLLPHKGVEHLIDAIPDGARLSVIGRVYDGEYFAHLQSRAAGQPVEFITEADDDRVIELLTSAQAFVLPSVYEDFRGRRQALPELVGLVLLEAMACGTPVICTRAGGMPEIITEGQTGFVVEPSSGPAIAAALGPLLDDPARAAAMGVAARADVLARFTWDAVARRCLDQYRSDA